MAMMPLRPCRQLAIKRMNAPTMAAPTMTSWVWNR